MGHLVRKGRSRISSGLGKKKDDVTTYLEGKKNLDTQKKKSYTWKHHGCSMGCRREAARINKTDFTQIKRDRYFGNGRPQRMGVCIERREGTKEEKSNTGKR